ncbi:MAG: PKD domain-containing protein, partial [Candidatus Vogelbacteria bacterium]|nr:PKD domain-containing protein [Candidatus Vogelbacteria bacterium]
MKNFISNGARKYILGLCLVALAVVPLVSLAMTETEQLKCQIYDLSHLIWELQGKTNPEPVRPDSCGIVPPVIGVPTITQKSGLVSLVYSPTAGGQQLKTSFSVDVTNNTGSTIYIPQSYRPFWPSFINNTTITRENKKYNEPSTCTMPTVSSIGVGDFPLVWDYSQTNNYLQVKAGQTLNYMVSKSCPVNQMHAGNYTAKLGDITWTTSMAPTMTMQSAPTKVVSSNSKLIVGEQGPWISQVVQFGKTPDSGWLLQGERLSKVLVYVNNNKVTSQAVRGGLYFNINLPAGNYPVFVKQEVGPFYQSNTVNLTIGGNNPGQVTINSVSGPNSLNINQEGNWTVNATAPSGTNLTYSVDWGDAKGKCGAGAKCGFTPTLVSQEANFKHTYTQAGKYTVRFRVDASNSTCPPCAVGTVCATCVATNNSAEASLEVEVVNNNSGQGVPVVTVNSSDISFSYDSPDTRSRQSLWTFFKFNVEARGGDIYLYKAGTFAGLWLVNSSNNRKAPDNCTRVSYPESKMTNIPVVTDSSGNQYYKISNGQKYLFYAQTSCYVDQMFSGNYYGKLGTLSYYRSPDINQGTYQELNLRTAGSEYIVGEQSPWIESVASVQNGQVVTIRGERLDHGQVVIKGSSYLPSDFKYSADGRMVTFLASENATTNYEVYLTSNFGPSNKVAFQIIVGNDNTQTRFSIVSPNGGETWKEGDQKDVTLSYNNMASGNVQILLGDRDLRKCLIANVPLNGVVTVTVPQIGSSQCPNLPAPTSGTALYKLYVIAKANDGTFLSDESDYSFTVNGRNVNRPSCGSASGVSTASAPTSNFCSNGTVGTVSTTATGWSWPCIVANNGASIVTTCSAPKSTAQPAITSITNPIVPGQKMSINGTNLTGAQDFGQVFVDNSDLRLLNVLIDGSKPSGTDSLLFFVFPSMAPGTHSLYVKTNFGTSNVVNFQVQNSVQPSPLPFVSGVRINDLNGVWTNRTVKNITWDFGGIPASTSGLKYKVGLYTDLLGGMWGNSVYVPIKSSGAGDQGASLSAS